MEVDSLPQSPLICNRPQNMDTTDGVATTPSPAAMDNNNYNSTKNKIYLENNLPVSPTENENQMEAPALTLHNETKLPRTKSLAETIETLKQNHPLTVNSAVSNLPDEEDSKFTSKLVFSQHSTTNPTSPNEGKSNESEKWAQMSCDIICNCDGTVYMTPSNLSSKLLTPDGVLNEPTDTHCLPFPVSAKAVYYHHQGKDDSEPEIYSYTVTENSASTENDHCLTACLPCRFIFSSIDALLSHARAVHNIITPRPISEESSAIVQQAGNQLPLLSCLSFNSKLSVADLVAKATGAQTLMSPSLGMPANQQLLASGHQRGSMTGCEDHPEGGIECPKCDLILSSTRSLGGHMTMMHSRNSCKTLKCPKCNWHYKYQETLEIHMKEKHPDTDQTCIYCVTKQAHPRLARGESYMCGYKPYRCDVCNYSTTTKGNLSIHMQSDKHINNIQEIQQNAAASSTAVTQLAQAAGDVSVEKPALPLERPSTSGSGSSSPPVSIGNSALMAAQSSASRQPSTSSSGASKSQKWRCDVCNYETSIARNLRIHMTSEKHTHNMLILQQNVRSMQRNMNMTLNSVGMTAGQADATALQQLQLGTMFPFDPLGVVGQMQVQLQQQGDSERPHMGDDVLPYKSKSSRDIYGCAICNNFTTDDLAELEAHLNIDRSATNNAEHVTITAENSYLCNLCEYKTPLKANFQLHCKTDRHMQRVQLVNHIREGGSDNEWRMKYLSMPNLVHIVCNVCSYQSNSLQKMKIHSLPTSHTIGSSLFAHLRRSDELSTKYHYCCGVCSETSNNKIHMVRHVLLTHPAQIESLRDDNWSKFSIRVGSPAPGDKVDCEVDEPMEASSDAVKDTELSLDGEKSCTQCSYTTHSDIVLKAHVTAKHPLAGATALSCPLCSDKLTSADLLEKHLFTTHNVNEEGVKKLMSTVDMPSVRRKTTREEDSEEIYRCQTCIKTFTDFDELCQHQNELGHLEMKATPRGPGYLCWKKGCNQYFRSTVALQTHFKEIHLRPTSGSPISIPASSQSLQAAATRKMDDLPLVKCFICPYTFRNNSALRKHVEVTHTDTMNEKELALYTRFMTTNILPEESITNKSIDDEEEGDADESRELIIDELTSPRPSSSQIISGTAESAALDGVQLTSPIIKKEVPKKDARPFKCAVCDVNFAASGQLDEHLRSTQHLSASAQLTRQISQNHSAASMDLVTPHGSVTAKPGIMNSYLAAEQALNELKAESLKAAATPSLSSSDDKYTDKLMSTSTAHADVKEEAGLFNTLKSTARTTPVPTTASNHSPPMYTCQPCTTQFVTKDVLIQHQKLTCPALHGSRRTRSSRNRFRGLLNNYGIECVMGFLESEQQRKNARMTTPNSSSDNESNLTDEDEMDNDQKMAALESLLPPEMSGGKLECSDCGQVFTGIWVLKTHKEEEHGQLLPEFITEHFGKLYKKDFDDKEEALNAASALAAETKNSFNENASNSSPLPLTLQSTPSAMAVKCEPISNMTPAKPTPVSASTGGPLDLLNYPWMGMFPFGMLPPNTMFNPMMPQMPGGMPSKTQQNNNNSLSSPPMMTSPVMENGGMMQRQQSLNMQTSNQQQLGGEKRARTRISDDQLKVLRQYFDINNSPSEQAINEMAMKTNLPPKVIKHWFRNTLFKERQRNKDSPYNFNNPPQTTLNLEEYEKTGRVPEKASAKFLLSEGRSQDTTTTPHLQDDVFSPVKEQAAASVAALPVTPLSTEPAAKLIQPENAQKALTKSEQKEEALPTTPVPRYDEKSMDSEPDASHASLYPTSHYDGSDDGEQGMMSPNSPHTSGSSDHNMFSKIFSSSSGSKRANRTRFSDYQVKTLNDYFEQNAYPKDEELELLSRRLQLPNRVIVVWFQNNRQKARKNYENSPSTTTESNATTSNQPPKATSYPCKKCGVVFTGYYELVKHQKRVCMKNNIVPLPFGNQDGLSQNPPTKDRTGKRHSLNDSSSSEKMAEMAKQASKPGQYLHEMILSSLQSENAYSDNCQVQQRLDSDGNLQKEVPLKEAMVKLVKHKSKLRQMQSAPNANTQKENIPTNTSIPKHSNTGTTSQHQNLSLSTEASGDSMEKTSQHPDIPKDSSSHQQAMIRLLSHLVSKNFRNTLENDSPNESDMVPDLKLVDKTEGLMSPSMTSSLPSATPMMETMPTAQTPELSAMMSYAASNPNFNLNSLFMNPFMPMPGMFGGMPSAAAPMQNMMKDFYDIKKLQEDAEKSAVKPELKPTSSTADIKHAGDKRPAPLDYNNLHATSSSSNQKVIKTSNASADESSHTKINNSSNYGDDDCNNSFCGSDEVVGDDFESSNSSGRMRTLSGSQSNASASASALQNSQQMKRFRTNLTNMQIHVMKLMFLDYKTPTMAECEMLGKFIGLQKRVVQVWFQNQRAKEKKHKQNNGLPSTDDEAHSTECQHCHVTYSHQLSIQEHLFAPRHINQLRQQYTGKLTETDRSAMRQQAEVRPQTSRRVSSTVNKKAEEPAANNPAMFSPTSSSNLSAAGRGNDYQAQLSRNLMSSLGSPLAAAGLPGMMPGLPNPADMMSLMYPNMLQSLSLLGSAGLLGGFQAEQSAAAAAAALGYNALDYGTPLNMLQIPQEAKNAISNKLSNINYQVASYTQDCKKMGDLAKQVYDMDYTLARADHTDVGYACRKCQLVFPRKEACIRHQATSVCYLGKSPADNEIVKIEQEQYNCQACNVNSATIQEFKQHCQGEPHKYNRNKYNNNNNTDAPSAKRLRAV